MKRTLIGLVSVILSWSLAASQTPQKPAQDIAPEDIVRITSELVQTDVVVTDKNDQIIKDLRLEDFELYDNGRKQDVKFMEFVGVDSARRREGTRPSLPAAVQALPAAVQPDVASGVSAKDLKRVIAFVVDDLTIPILDLPTVRNLLLDFVNNKMADGDLVAIVRVVGGKGLLQQFTTDRQLLRRAIATIRPVSHPQGVSDTPEPGYIKGLGTLNTDDQARVELDDQLTDAPENLTINDDANRFFRGLSALTTAGFVLNSLKEIPGHKNLVIISGGIPIFEVNATGSQYSNVSSLLGVLSDRAFRGGVAINTLDPRGLSASRGVAGYLETGSRTDYVADIQGRPTGFGRGGDADQAAFGSLLAGAGERLGLDTVAKATGGVSVANTNDFSAGLEKILARSSGYYTLAYAPIEKFDGKVHKIDIKVHRNGAKLFHPDRYIAKEDQARGERTKEQQIVAAASSPLTRRDIDVTPNVAIKLLAANKASVDIHLLIDATRLNFTETGGKFQTSLDVVGLVFDQLGKQRGGFSETINLDLSKENYQRALTEGLTYSATTELPSGYYQIRAVVRESSSGGLGTFSKYIEIPDLAKGRLAMSSVFLFAVDGSNPIPLEASRQLKRTQDLRYVAMIYNAKMKGGKPQVNSQMIISQAGKILLREPEQPVEPLASAAAAVIKVGQFGLSKVPPGRYILTLIISDPTADKKDQPLSRSIDFIVAK